MGLPPFELHRPKTLPDALRLMSELGDDSAFYMGGTELLLLMKLGFASPHHLVDGKGIPELGRLFITSDSVSIGAGVTHRRLERHPDVRRLLPTLSAMEASVANVRVRNVGTIGGNLCFAEPHSDPLALMVALGADVVLTSLSGERTVPLEEFTQGAFTTALRPAELMSEVRLPVPGPDVRVGYERLAFKERPDVSAAVVLDSHAPSVVVGAVSGRPIRVSAAERLLADSGGEDIEGAAAATSATIADVDHAEGADYRAHLAGVLVARACRAAVAGGTG